MAWAMTKRTAAAPSPRWTFTMLTIPSRVEYLGRLLQSLAALPGEQPFEVVIVYNSPTDEEPMAVEQRIRAMAPSLPVRVYINSTDPTIGGGRRVQLSVCRTPLVAFIDDDLTLHGDVLRAIEDTLRARPVGIVGLPSYEEDTDTRFKPRDSTPHVDVDGIRYMPVQGMLVAGYRRLFSDIGGFNPRRQFWGEWTEFNLRMWRHGFPTGYVLDRGFLRHWHKAPESPTRNMSGREQHVLWGLMCTALEYDAVSINEATDAFWRLAQDRYLQYSFGEQPSSKQLLASVLELMPRLSREFPAIHAFADDAKRHPFHFKPFEPLDEAQVRTVIAHAQNAIAPYRAALFDDDTVALPPATTKNGWLRRIGKAMFARRAQTQDVA
jgi:glycosyltransferase involved in cell wall biosynthesis